jgi:hypothetical protein
MSQPTNQGGDPGSGGNNNQPDTGGHPAWDEVLSLIPEEQRPAATEKLRAWDTGVNERFTKLHSEYEPYKPFIGEYSPEDLQTAVQIANALQSDPAAFHKQLAAAYGLDSGQGPGNQQQQQTGNSPEELFADNPELKQFFDDKVGKLEQAIGALAQNMLDSQQMTQQQQEDQMLEQALAQLHKDHGEFDEDYVLAKIANGVDPEEAIKQFKTLSGQTERQEANNNLPTFLSGGGGLPTNQIDPTKLDSKGTKDLVAGLLEAANKQ